MKNKVQKEVAIEINIYDNWDTTDFPKGNIVVYQIHNKLLGLEFVHYIEKQYFTPTFIPDYFAYDRQRPYALEMGWFVGKILSVVQSPAQAEKFKLEYLQKNERTDGQYNFDNWIPLKMFEFYEKFWNKKFPGKPFHSIEVAMKLHYKDMKQRFPKTYGEMWYNEYYNRMKFLEFEGDKRPPM